MKSFNYLSLLSLFSLFALASILGPDPNLRFLSALGYLGYLSYLMVRPDELFMKNVYKAATYSFLMVVLMMGGFMFYYYLFGGRLIELDMAFWVLFAIIHISFNAFLIGFELKEGVYEK